MADDFGIGGSFLGRVDRVLGPAHRGARVYQVSDSPMMPAVTSEHCKAQQSPPSRGIYLLPNLLTTGCLFSGFYSIVAAIDRNFALAGRRHFIAMLFDGLDGRVARWTRTESPIRQGIRQSRGHGRLRCRSGGAGLSMGRDPHLRIRRRMAPIRLGHRILLLCCALRCAWRASISTRQR